MLRSMDASRHAKEIDTGRRFAFGSNWRQFLRRVNDERITMARHDLGAMLGAESFDGCSFLDIGSGSGLSSLAARRLGATVMSFDYDPASVACTRELRSRYQREDSDWIVQEGSILDEAFVRGLGTYDIVYSWGVLHHTGDQWRALDNAISCVAPGGRLFVALYNDQGLASRIWLRVKRTYNRSGPNVRRLLAAVSIMWFEGRSSLLHLVRGERSKMFMIWRAPMSSRGMSPVHDVIDWTGGYPFEVSTPEQVFDFCRLRGFRLERLTTAGGGSGCNQYVFRRDS